ncbi:uncharacterized protein EAE98_005653 [Botrytis deweyae]|uniref:Uncharacterized protein n=1 Tax=Botrytis deweyae TaxID=2478750 RepID=A0ABQ7INA2_9HELO|nr:uncharacterized protein EAE98_005653 [Botrytis deweyae]KAF7928597.1 hypothetical protein EAE98_005653 [Botrytis deweyae]KAF7938063.1 hypothetical protein EAE99_001735 [Botrytis elliptica]
MGAKELFFKLRKFQNGIKPSCAQNPQLQRVSTNESLTFSFYERRKATENRLAKERGARNFLVEEEQRKRRKDEKNRIKNEAKEARQKVAEEYAMAGGQLSLQEMNAQLKKSKKEEKATNGCFTPRNPDEDDIDGEWDWKGDAVSLREWA